MKIDELERQLADYGRAVLDDVPELDPEALTTAVAVAEAGRPSARYDIARVPGWAVAVAVTIGVLAVGAAAALLTLPGDEEPAAATTAPRPAPVVVPVDPVIVETPLGTMQWTFRSDRHPITYGLVEWEGRLVGLTSQGDALRATDDGLSWVTVGSLPDLHSPAGLAAHDGYLYLIDSRTRMPEGYLIRHPSAWRSPDLSVWEPVPVEQQIPGDYIGEIEVVASDAGLVVTAEAGFSNSGAAPSALLWALADEGFASSEFPGSPDYAGRATRMVWAVDGGFATSTGFFSDDGASWTEASSGAEDRGILAVGRGPGGYLAIAEYGRSVLASDNGVDWQRLTILVESSTGEPALGGGGPVPIGSGWIVLEEWATRLPSARVSADGEEWPGTTPVPGVLFSDPVAVGPDLVLARWWAFTDGYRLPAGTVEIRLLDD